jgi:anti-sigma B factor antagonist
VPLTITAYGTGAVRLSLTGELDLASVGRLRQAVDAAFRAGGVTSLTVDLAGVAFLDSTGMAGLISARRMADAFGASFAATNATGAVAWVLDVAGVGAYLGTVAG